MPRSSMQNGEKTRLIKQRRASSYGSIEDYDEPDTPLEIVDSYSERRTHFTRRDGIVVFLILLAASVAIIVTLVLGLPKIRAKREKYFNPEFPVSPYVSKTFDNAAVVADGLVCASFGRKMLEMGGSAVDAAVSTLFCNGAVNPQSMGLGGGLFMTLYHSASRTAEVIDARETAPSGAWEGMFHSNNSLSIEGGLAVAVPGELRGYWLAHQKYGKLNWSTLIEPTIQLCLDGFPVSQHLADKIEMKRDRILEEESLRELFFNNETQDLYKAGENMTRPVLAKTLQAIADKGADEFYKGEIARNIIKDLRSFGGIIALRDMKNYTALSKPAVVVSLRDGEKMYTVPPPGSGPLLAFILNILDGYNFTKASIGNIGTTIETFHKTIEAFKFAYAKRTMLGDDQFIDMQELLTNLTSKDYAESVRKRISELETFPPEYYDPVYYAPDAKGTAQVSVIAPNGDAVSATSTVNTQFGALIRSKSTGIIFNSEMDDFSSPNITNYFGLPPSPANFIAPGKRPLSSMAPAVIVDKEGVVRMVIGGAGGTRITTASSEVLMRVLWMEQSLKEAIDALRLHHQLEPNVVQYEKGFPQIYLDGLQTYGHQVAENQEQSVILGILREKNKKLVVNLDHRKGGSLAGY